MDLRLCPGCVIPEERAPGTQWMRRLGELQNCCGHCVEIKCQLDATDYIYCRFYCMLNMFRAILCPSSGAREYYTGGRCLWYFVLWFSGCRYGVELEVMCPVCRLLQQPAINIICNKYNLLHLVGILFPHNDDSRSK